MEAGTGDTYAVVMIDLDDLKEVNDTYGHESGDQYIISAAEILKKIVGESGLTARHGGDEFVLFLEEKSEEALQEKLLQLKSAQDSSEAVLHDGQHVPLRFWFLMLVIGLLFTTVNTGLFLLASSFLSCALAPSAITASRAKVNNFFIKFC